MTERTPTAEHQASFGKENDYAVMHNMVHGYVISQMVRCAVMFSFPEHLEHGPATAQKIAAAEGLDGDATFRLMRACASVGLMTYDREKGFSATSLLRTLHKDDPKSMRSRAFVHPASSRWKLWSEFPEVVRTGKPQAAAILGSSLWEYYASPAGAEEAKAFTEFMSAVSDTLSGEAARLIDTKAVDFVIDLGGANGSLVQALMKNDPHLRGAVLDLPHVMADAGTAATALGLQNRFSAIAGDFLVEVPPADLYLLRYILHDWADEECIAILRNCRRAMQPNGRLVIIDKVVEDIEPRFTTTQADLMMMVLFGSKERTMAEFKALLDAAALRLTKVTPIEAPLTILEAAVA